MRGIIAIILGLALVFLAGAMEGKGKSLSTSLPFGIGGLMLIWYGISLIIPSFS